VRAHKLPLVGVLCLAACTPQAPKDASVVAPAAKSDDSGGSKEGRCARQREATQLASRGDATLSVHVVAAIAQYAEASELAPEDHTILFRLGMAYKKTENWSAEQVALSKATELAPQFANYWYELGLSFMRQAEEGDRKAYEHARVPLETCTQVDPNSPECWYQLAQSALWTDDLELALVSYTRASERDPKKAEFYAALADVYLDLKLYEEARRVLETAIAQLDADAPGLHAIHLLVAEVHAARGEPRKRLAALEMASSLAPVESPEAWYHLAVAYVELNPPDLANARRAVKKFIERGCRGRGALRIGSAADEARRGDQCGTSQALSQRLGL
jgi:tetratricopeptide (TPR) repeat protein